MPILNLVGGGLNKEIEIIGPTIVTPIIQSPENNSNIYFNSVTVVSSTFIPIDNQDTHVSSDWKITSDDEGNNIVVQDLNSSDLTTHTFIGLDFPENNIYYIFVRYYGMSGGLSTWSNPVAFRVKNGITTTSGHFLYRHASNMGTVMIYQVNGIERKTLILDAQYRKGAALYTTDDKIPTNCPVDNNGNVDGNWWFRGSSYGSSSISNITNHGKFVASMTDEYLESIWPYMKTIPFGFSKSVTNILMSTNGSDYSPAARHARSVTVPGLGPCDLPDRGIASRAYMDADYLDELDPTVSLYPKYGLSMQYTGNSYYCWFDGDIFIQGLPPRDRNYQFYVPGDGNSRKHSAATGVMPIIELE